MSFLPSDVKTEDISNFVGESTLLAFRLHVHMARNHYYDFRP